MLKKWSKGKSTEFFLQDNFRLNPHFAEKKYVYPIICLNKQYNHLQKYNIIFSPKYLIFKIKEQLIRSSKAAIGQKPTGGIYSSIKRKHLSFYMYLHYVFTYQYLLLEKIVNIQHSNNR